MAIRGLLHHAERRPHPAGTQFEVGELKSGCGVIAIAETGEGNSSAAAIAERAIATFQPEALSHRCWSGTKVEVRGESDHDRGGMAGG